MLSEAEFLYFKEVLGVEPFETRRDLDDGPVHSQLPAIEHEVVVCAPALSAPELVLLNKILGAIHLTQFSMLEKSSCEKSDILELHGKDILTFIEGETLKAPEVIEMGEKTWWRLLPMSSMLTENEQLNSERKKQVWALLQRFAAR